MRIFTDSSDSIKHRGTSGNSRRDVMLSRLNTDNSTIYGTRYYRRPVDLDGGESSCGSEEKIGTLIACRKRHQYAMLCEAELDSVGSTGRRPGGRRAEI